jgi:hypothetical protein
MSQMSAHEPTPAEIPISHLDGFSISERTSIILQQLKDWYSKMDLLDEEDNKKMKMPEILETIENHLDRSDVYNVANILWHLYGGLIVCQNTRHHGDWLVLNHEPGSGWTLQTVGTVYSEMRKGLHEILLLIAKIDLRDNISKTALITMIRKNNTYIFANSVVRELDVMSYRHEFLKKMNEDYNVLGMAEAQQYDIVTGETYDIGPDDPIMHSTGHSADVLQNMDATLVQEVHRYMETMWPDPEQLENAWDIFSECLQSTSAGLRNLIVSGGHLTGKSTLVRLLSKALGDYATSLPSNAFKAPFSRYSARPDLVKLKGTRLVMISDDDESISRSPDEQLMRILNIFSDRPAKEISARPLYGESVAFEPRFKTMVTTSLPIPDLAEASRHVQVIRLSRQWQPDERLPADWVEKHAATFLALLVQHRRHNIGLGENNIGACADGVQAHPVSCTSATNWLGVDVEDEENAPDETANEVTPTESGGWGVWMSSIWASTVSPLLQRLLNRSG